MTAKKFLFGIIFIVLGIFLLLSLFNVLALPSNIFSYWPVLLIIAAIGMLLDRNSSLPFPIALAAFGTLFLLKNLDVSFMSDVSMWKVGAAIFVIYIGMEILFPKKFKLPKKNFKNESLNGDNIKRHCFFSESSSDINAQNFTYGDFSSTFGSLSVHMSGTRFNPDGSVINAHVSFGNLEIYLPRDTSVNLVNNIKFGETDNHPNPGSSCSQTVTINTSGSFGNVEIFYI